MRRWLAFVPLLILLAPPTAVAQTLRLSGVIVDPSGGVLPAVEVRVTPASGTSQTPITAKTDAVGRYEFRLPPGAYALATSLPGFASVELSLKLADADVQRNIMLKVGSLQETITITPGPADAPPPPRIGPAAPPAPPAPGPAFAPSSPTSAAAPGPPPARPGTPIRVGGSLKPPTKTANVRPVYPAALAAEKIGGTVILEATIGSDGHVQDVKTLRSPRDELTRAATDALEQWEFTPTLLNGAPTPVIMTATFNFQAE